MNTRTRRNITWAVSFAGCVFFVGLGLYWLKPSIAGPAQRADRPVTVRLGGDEFKIPRNYFYGGVPNADDADMLLFVLLPKLQPYDESNKDKFIRGDYYIATILVTDAIHTTTAEFRLGVARTLSAPLAYQGKIYGLESYAPVGLGVINKGQLRKNIFVDSQAQVPDGFLACDADGSGPALQCEHDFTYKNLLIQTSYGRKFLPQWHSIEGSVKGLLDSLSAPPPVAKRQDSEGPISTLPGN